MLDSRDVGGLQGAPVFGNDGEKLGSIGQVFLDATTGSPNWVTVKTGLFGHKETFVPLANATWDGERVTVDTDKEALKEAPRIGADEALSPHNEEALYRYYGLSDADTDGGTARPDHYPDREYELSPNGETVTPVPAAAGTQADATRTDADRTDADRARPVGDGRAADPQDLRLSEQPLGASAPPSTETAHTGEHLGKHARMRRYEPDTSGPVPGTADPTIDRTDPPRTM
ncbi:sporulation protein YlmC with PRC-barrel domain [Mycetocola sp. CAN_C7]|uniref:PRC-barrel domain-containing protein n=1 Tax=Mycetocola sp. CAN_C7 TaxID=2787724 RepID=UPI0018C9846C